MPIHFEAATGSVRDSSSKEITQLPRIADATMTSIALLPPSTNHGDVDCLVWTKSAEQSDDASGPSFDLFVPAIIERRKVKSRAMIDNNDEHDSWAVRRTRKRKLIADVTDDEPSSIP